MAISRLVAPTDPPTADANWTQLINWVKLALLSIELPFRMDWAGGLLKKGAIFYVSGTPYLNDTDVTPSGTASTYVKLTPSGDGSVLTASYVANLTGVTWSTVYNGWYDGSTPACLYIFDEHLAVSNSAITAANFRNNRDINFFGHQRVNIGSGNTSSGTNASAIGMANLASGLASLSSGYNNSATATASISVGSSNSNSSSYGAAIGYSNTVSKLESFAVGANNIVSAENSVAIGTGNTITVDDSFVIGNNCQSSAIRTIAIGNTLTVNRVDETAIGGIRKEIYLSTETENAVFDSLYALLGSDATARKTGAIGSFGTSAVQGIEVVGSSSINIILLGVASKLLTNGNTSQIGSKLKIQFLYGLHT